MTEKAIFTTPLDLADRPARVLVVDDMPANVLLLASILKLEGIQVATATSGPEALELVPEFDPDVVLLDVMMPGMDGFEVCARIRETSYGAHLPVVMVTALKESGDRVRAIELGADDFLSKPVDGLEVVSRVRSLTRAKRDREALEQAYADLRRAEHLRDNLAEMLVHDLRTPLTTMLASLDLMKSGQAGELSDLQKQVISFSVRGGQHLLSLINEILDIGKMENGEMKLEMSPVDIPELFDEAWTHLASQADANNITLKNCLTPVVVEADEDLIKRVLINLLGNAVKFSRRSTAVTIFSEVTDGHVVLKVRDQGPGIDPGDQERIFEKFGQVEARKEGRRISSGLGLTFCKLAVEAHHGEIGVDSVLEEGSTFWVKIPC